MYHSLRQRFDDIVYDITDTLTEMAPDPRLMPAGAIVRSSASTPSLRARDPGMVPPHARYDAGGNVRVVVRVRAFLPRGEWAKRRGGAKR
jgi:hypothetical protein